MLGRTPRADERRIMDAIGALPCICCHLMGRENPVISLHHTSGRTALDAHKRVLPLCAWHHDTPASKEVREQYPDLVPYHARGSFGGPAAWRKIFGKESRLLNKCYEMAGLKVIKRWSPAECRLNILTS
ncbi:MAG: Ref family recombination enhancement nuclease [Aeromonas sp.]